MYQQLGKVAYKADLSNTLLVAEYLGHPERGFKSVHVAGTNGKGSTSHMLASVLQEAGYKVGLYTSPHLKDFRERIKINGVPIAKRNVSSFVTKHKAFFETHKLSFFEMTVGLAFDYFQKQQVDVAIVEVGLGGRLDSTNVITPEVSVITNIGLDHTQLLGDTLEEIAAEKAGIIKSKVPVVIGETTRETKNVFLSTSEILAAPIVFAEEEAIDLYPSDLQGAYQKLNQRTARITLEQLRSQGWYISEKNIRNGLRNVVRNTGLLGRWQILKEYPKVIVDTAHNREGLALTMKQLLGMKAPGLHIVLGFVNDKQLEIILPLFPKSAIYYFCAPNNSRALPVDVLTDRAAGFGCIGRRFTSVKKAYLAALKNANEMDVVYLGGSTFVVAEIL